MADTQRRRRRRQLGGPTPDHATSAASEPRAPAGLPDEAGRSTSGSATSDAAPRPRAAALRPRASGVPGPAQNRTAPNPATYDSGRDGRADDRDIERGLRGLVGGGASQVGVSAAMRARDASRPSEADLAVAEADLVIVRRNWTPREPR